MEGLMISYTFMASKWTSVKLCSLKKILEEWYIIKYILILNLRIYMYFQNIFLFLHRMMTIISDADGFFSLLRESVI